MIKLNTRKMQGKCYQLNKEPLQGMPLPVKVSIPMRRRDIPHDP
jgi:hypothetical protein